MIRCISIQKGSWSVCFHEPLYWPVPQIIVRLFYGCNDTLIMFQHMLSVILYFSDDMNRISRFCICRDGKAYGVRVTALQVDGVQLFAFSDMVFLNNLSLTTPKRPPQPHRSGPHAACCLLFPYVFSMRRRNARSSIGH